MIDVHDVATRIIDASRSPVPGNVALQRAVRVTTEKLADCWDDCAATVLAAERSAAKTFPPDPDGEPGNWQAMNPYRLALEKKYDGPHAPRVEFVDEPDEPENDSRLRHMFVTTVDDPEIAAMQIMVEVLANLDQRAQNRVITYISERMA